MGRRVLAMPVAVLLASCTVANDPVDFPFDSYDYATEHVRLGISFPPLNGEEEYRFTFDRMTELSMDRLRFDIHWDSIEPTEGDRRWDSLGFRLDTLTSRGYELFCTIDLKSFPPWFAALDSDARLSAFGTFVQELLAGYGDKIHLLQFGNEWNWEIDSYLNGDLDQFIALADLMAAETLLLSPGERPEVVLVSPSTAGLAALAFSQGRIPNVFFGDQPLYTQAELDAFDKSAYLEKVNRIFTEIRFEVIDLHLYAEYWLWETYRDAAIHALRDSGMSGSYPIVASEFGGPHHSMESLDQETQADRIVSYIRTIDDLGIREAYFFTLVEHLTRDREYWNSYLVDSNLNKTLGFEVVRRFGEAAMRGDLSRRRSHRRYP